MADDAELLQKLVRRLDILIMLQMDGADGSQPTTKSKIERLLGLGLAPAEVASVIGKPVNYVTAVTASSKTASKKKKRKAKSSA